MDAIQAQYTEAFRRSLASFLSISDTVKEALVAEFARRIVTDIPRFVVTRMRQEVQRELHLSVLGKLEQEYAMKNSRVPVLEITRAFDVAREAVIKNPMIQGMDTADIIQRELWKGRRSRKSPMAAALLQAGVFR